MGAGWGFCHFQCQRVAAMSFLDSWDVYGRAPEAAPRSSDPMRGDPADECKCPACQGLPTHPPMRQPFNIAPKSREWDPADMREPPFG